MKTKPKGKKPNKPSKGKGNKGYNNKENKDSRINAPFDGQSIKAEDDARETVRKTSHANDPDWYGVSSQMVQDTARISFNNPAGLPQRVWAETDNFNASKYFNNKTIPGIMILNYAYGPGVSIDRSSALNLAANNLYAFVRHVNSGASNYETADLMMYMLGVSTCYVYYKELLRLYGYTLMYRQSNRYFNDALIRSFGFNTVEIEKHLPQLRFTINKFARKIGTKPIPANLKIFQRMLLLPGEVFTDANVKKAQFYVFKPSGYYTYEELSDHGTYLKWNTVADAYQRAGADISNGITVEAIETLTEFMANKLLDSEDVGIISGDIMKAYGDNIFKIFEINESFMLQPVFAEDILDQIHNCTIMGTASNMDVTQTYSQNLGSTIIWSPTMNSYPDAGSTDVTKSAYQSRMDGNATIDLPYDDPTPVDVMEATRLLCRVTSGANPIMMTEFVESASIISLDEGGYSIRGPIYGILNASSVGPNVMEWVLNTVDKWTKFDRGPAITIFQTNNDFHNEATVYDYYNYTYVGAAEIAKMHETAILSLWDVPETAFYTAV